MDVFIKRKSQRTQRFTVKIRSLLIVYSYISEIFKYRVHLELGRVTVVDAETSGFLIAVLVHFLQQRHKTSKEQKKTYKL